MLRTFHCNPQRTGRQRLCTRQRHWAIRTWIQAEWKRDDSVLVSPTSNIQPTVCLNVLRSTTTTTTTTTGTTTIIKLVQRHSYHSRFAWLGFMHKPPRPNNWLPQSTLIDWFLFNVVARNLFRGVSPPFSHFHLLFLFPFPFLSFFFVTKDPQIQPGNIWVL